MQSRWWLILFSFYVTETQPGIRNRKENNSFSFNIYLCSFEIRHWTIAIISFFFSFAVTVNTSLPINQFTDMIAGWAQEKDTTRSGKAHSEALQSFVYPTANTEKFLTCFLWPSITYIFANKKWKIIKSTCYRSDQDWLSHFPLWVSPF